MSQNLTEKQKSKKKIANLPDAETLYDELEVSRKEVANQRKVIKAQKTRNDRLEADLKKREHQIEEVLTGHNGKERLKLTLVAFKTKIKPYKGILTVVHIICNI